MLRIILIILVCLIAGTRTAAAYIGPGAGFAITTSVFGLAATILLVLFILILSPLRLAAALLRSGVKLGRATRGRVVVLGLDGLDPKLARAFMDHGDMPHCRALADQGHFGPLRTTCPAISPVAWSTFATGVNPGRHNIFDFLSPNTTTYAPELSSVKRINNARLLKIGPFVLPLRAARFDSTQKSRPFWEYAAECGVTSMILRVPMTYPAAKGRALVLSGLCAPDLRGSQGTFSIFSDNADDLDPENVSSGSILKLQNKNGCFHGVLPGPPDPLNRREFISTPFRLTPLPDGAGFRLRIRYAAPVILDPGRFSPWIRMRFRVAPGLSVHGLCRFLVTQTQPHVRLYATPVHIDPARPAMPVSHPRFLSVYFEKLIGPFATAGLAEDTSAVNAGFLDEDHFLSQVYDCQSEREAMLDLALDRVRAGLVVCVFDAPDRVQHLFLKQHRQGAGPHAQAIRDAYRRMDALVGSVMNKLKPDDTLFIVSDHGVAPFERCFNTNAWLAENGYLAAEPGAASINWTQTRAFGMGLAGIHINRAGKFPNGIVQALDANNLRNEIIEKLKNAIDPETGEKPLRAVYAAGEIYDGPYVENAPDIILCFEEGYRTAWESVTGGGCGGPVFYDNNRPWSGDHTAHPDAVPGTILSNRQITIPDPHIGDIAPTALSIFGIQIPGHIQGRSLFDSSK